MTGVTIGTGEFVALAEQAAQSFRDTTGLPCVVLGDSQYNVSGLAYPHHMKYKMFDLVDDDVLIYFDADLWWMRNWDPVTMIEGHEGKLMVVRDLIKAPHIVKDSELFNLDLSDYFNSGLMVLHRDPHVLLMNLARSIFDRIISDPRLGPKERSKFKDQTSLNLAVQMADFPVHFLDRRYNFVQEAEMWMRKGFPIIGAHKPRRKLPKENKTDLQKWQEFFERGMPESEFFMFREDLEALAGVYEITYEGHNAIRAEFLQDGTIAGAGYHEGWWWPFRTKEGDMEMHVTGSAGHPKKRCEEMHTMSLQKNGSEWKGRTLISDEILVTLRKLA
jgi:hypothetical protein